MKARNKRNVVKATVQVNKRPYQSENCRKVTVRYKNDSGRSRTFYVPQRAGRR